jgi:hypothetical protein
MRLNAMWCCKPHLDCLFDLLAHRLHIPHMDWLCDRHEIRILMGRIKNDSGKRYTPEEVEDILGIKWGPYDA